MSELPDPWRTAAERVGIRQTLRGIADAADLSHVTVQRLIREGRTSPTTVAKIADKLQVDEATIYEWAGVELSEWGPWIPPRESHRLSPRARAALEELIRAVTQEGDDDGRTPAAEKSAGGRQARDEDVAVVGGLTVDASTSQSSAPSPLSESGLRLPRTGASKRRGR